MKICHIIFSLTTGGTEAMLVDIMNEQVETETITLIIVNSLINDSIVNKIGPNIRIIKINRKPSSKNPISLLKINQCLFQLKPDIIHFHNVNGIGLILPHFRKKAILTIHDTKIQYPFFVRYKKLFAISQSVKQDIFRRYGLEPEVVYNGICTSAITVKQKQEQNTRFRIVQTGRLQHTKKGQDLSIKVMKQLVHNYGRTNIYLDFIGEGASVSFLKQLVIDNKLENRIAFLGNTNREDIYKHLCEYDLLIQPSINEGFGLTVLEAMTAKIPVLVSDIEGPMENIENGKYGYYFKTEDVDDFAAKIINIIDNRCTKNHIQMIEDAYTHATANFDVKNTALNYLNTYKTIIKSLS
jgi:glycosyltransferase involved in cell wall biosynthesis